MALTSGIKLGPYEILSPLGAGGMGEVYRARDIRLNRTVAIKILNSAVVSSPELKQRFEREARAIAQLNHPHICTLYDIGRQDATDYLVMEFLDGESLAERLRRGALPIVEVLKIGTEVADALDKAHRIGIVHRDIKPGNIVLTKDGSKLLDFGLAKPLNAIASAAKGNGSPPSFTAAPTLTSPSPLASPITTEGTVLGTIQYMSPEQIEGKEADTRSDIFSFGATLYEMVTGKRAFQGKSQLKVASAILEDEPQPVNLVVPNVAPALDHVITTCLKKDPDERFQSAADLKLELKWAAQLPVVVPTNEADLPSRGSRLPRLVGVAALILIGLLIAGGFWVSSLRRQVAHKSLPTRASILPGGDLTYRVQTNFALSPDGRRLAFYAYGPKGDLTLWVRDLASLTDQEFPNTENAYLPFWSPDGRYIGFFANGKLRKVDSLGGPPQVVADAVNPRGGAWGVDGVIVFAPATGGSLFRVSAAGGEASPVAMLDRSASSFNSYRYPFFLPDGRHFLFLARGNPDTVMVGSVDGGEPKTLLPGSNAAYAAGYLLFMRQNTLMAQRFNPDRLELQGDPVLLASGVAFDQLNHVGAFTVAEDTLIYEAGSGLSGMGLRIFDRAGKERVSFLPTSPEEVPLTVRFSPDGERIATQVFNPGKNTQDLWIYEPARGLRTRFTLDPSSHYAPLWSPDGSQIAFSSNQKGHADLYVKPANLSQPEQPLLQNDMDKAPEDWSPDGKFLLYAHYEGIPAGAALRDLWLLPFSGDRKPSLFLAAGNATIRFVRFSPDGRWVAYQSSVSGTPQVYITSFPDHQGVWQVSTEGGQTPVWGPGRKELFFLNQDKVYSVEIADERGAPKPSTPKFLFEARAAVLGAFDVSRDGKKFLVVTHVETGSTRSFTLVSNWTADLRK